MKNKWLMQLLMAGGAILFISCHVKNKTVSETNPALLSGTVKGITLKIADDPGNASLYYTRGEMLHKQRQDTLALKDYKKAISLDSTKAQYYSAAGDLLFDHKDITGSVPFIQKAIALNPDDAKAHLKVAKMFVYIKDYPKAFKELNRVMEHDVYDPEPYFLKGMIYKDIKDTTKAMSSFLTAIQVAPDYKDAMIQLGQLYAARHNSIAVKYFSNAFKIDTGDVFPIFAAGVFYQNEKDYDRAKDEYKNCILHDNQYADAYFNTGYILIQQDSLEKAWRQYNLVTQIEPNNAGAYYNRGLCSELMHKNKEAINDYKQALAFSKNYEEPANGLKRLGAK